MARTSVKDLIADKMRVAGYDFLTAYEQAEQCIQEFKASGDKRRTFHIMKQAPGLRKIVDAFTLEKNS